MENLSPVALSCSVRLWKANSLQVISKGEVSSCEASLLVLYEHPNYSTKNIMSSYPVFEKNYSNTVVIKMEVSNKMKKINYNKLFLL